MDIIIDTTEINELVRILDRLRGPHADKAHKDALNTIAFAIRKAAQFNIRETFTNRNQYTFRSIRVDKSRSFKDAAWVGSVAPYMPLHEFGGKINSRGKHGAPIALPAAAGQIRAKKRTKVVRRKNRMKNVNLRTDSKIEGMPTGPAKNAARIRHAKKTGARLVFLNNGKVKGVFRVLKKGIRLQHDMSHRVLKIPKRPFLLPAIRASSRYNGLIYKKKLELMVRKAFGYGR